MKLENWFVTLHTASPYLAPELGTQRLCGNVYGHPNFPDGSPVTTSSIRGRVGNYALTKSGSLYELGVVDPDYEKAYPDARQRLLSSLPEIPS